jgi:tetratricopeptide (TPR) repeat protein
MVYYALSEIYQIRDDKEKAALCEEKAYSLDEGKKKVNLSVIALKSVQADTSKTAIADSKAKLLFNSGNTKYRNGDIEGALKAYDSAIVLKPDYYKAYNNRAIIKANDLKKDKEALNDFDKAIELNADYADAYLGRGTSKYNLKDIEGACSDWRKSSELGNEQASLQIARYCK